MADKRQLVLDAFNNKPTERVPVGFWFHYTKDELKSAYDLPETENRILQDIKSSMKVLNLTL